MRKMSMSIVVLDPGPGIIARGKVLFDIVVHKGPRHLGKREIIP